jgi:hypothetical protein
MQDWFSSEHAICDTVAEVAAHYTFHTSTKFLSLLAQNHIPQEQAATRRDTPDLVHLFWEGMCRSLPEANKGLDAMIQGTLQHCHEGIHGPKAQARAM